MAEIEKAILPMSGVIGRMVYAIAGIAALFYIGEKVWKSFANNEPIDFYPLLKPFVIGVLILNFNGLVIKPINMVFGPFIAQSEKLVTLQQEKNKHMVKDAYEDALKERDKPKEGDDGGSSFFKKVGEFFETIYSLLRYVFSTQFIKDVVLSLVLWVLSWLASIISFLFVILSKVLLIFLALVGPIAFAISLFPNFSGALTNWLSKYISILLWYPICNILQAMLMAFTGVIWSHSTVNDIVSGSSPVDTMALQLLTVLMYVITLLLYTAVPTLSTYIIPNGEGGQIFQGMRAIGQAFMGYAGAKAGTAAGRASKGSSSSTPSAPASTPASGSTS